MRKTYFGEEAVKAGLVDGIGSCQAILNEHFPECKIV
jgi:ClpP class serine protease